MLFGSKELQERLIAEVHNVEKEKNIRVVFGATVGSISKGIQYYDSDYDSRFLFVKDDFPKKIFYTPNAKESEVVYRHMPDQSVIDELIPFWEMTSFLQYLAVPGLDNKFSLGIYNIISWTFLSPYIWDPYGIQSQIVSVINSIFVREYKIGFHVKEILSKLKELEATDIIARNYLDMIYSALIIEYCINYNLQPPTHYRPLAAASKNLQMYERVNSIVDAARSNAYKYIRSEKNVERHVSHLAVKIPQDKFLTDYILRMLEQGKALMEDRDFLTNECKIEMKNKISIMYDIIANALEKVAVKDIL